MTPNPTAAALPSRARPDGISPAPGTARLRVEQVQSLSTIVHCHASSPIRVLTPCPRGTAAWAILSSLGGGHVAGDQTRVDVEIGPGARCYLGTQASTKIYRNPQGRPSSHAMTARCGAGSVLVHLPDPVQPFAGSTYDQRQSYFLEAGAGLVLLDWLTAGRAACGERWAFHRVSVRNEIHGADGPLLIDALRLDARDGPIHAPARTGRCNCLAVLVVLGPPVLDGAAAILANTRSRPVTRGSPLVLSASPLGAGAILRMAGEDVEEVGSELRRHLAFVPSLLGEDPWSRKW